MAKTRSNGEGNIRLRSDGRYEVRVSGGVDFTTGQHIRIPRYANSMEEAIQLLHKLNLAVGNSSAIQNQKIVLEDWLELWIGIYMKGHLKQSTYMSYETYARKHFNPALGKPPLTELTPRLLQQLYNYKMETEKLSPKSISNMNLYLHKALDQAVREGIIPDNPASHLDLPHSPRPQVTIFTRDEQARLVRASYQHRYGVFIRLVLMTGIRLGELLGHYSVSFTLDTYAHVLDDHKWEGMQLMDELYSIDQSAPGQQVYPLLVTPENGGYTFTAPDFPQVSIWAGTVEDGLPQIRAALKDTLRTQVYPPVATPLNEVIAQPGQFSLQIAL